MSEYGPGHPFRAISLGAGVQSSTLAYMAAAGELDAPTPDAAIFADTQNEPPWVYDTLERVRKECDDTFPVYRVSEGDLLEDALAGDFAALPLFTTDAGGRVSKLRRQCTREYKIAAVKRKIRELAGFEKHSPGEGAAEVWIGISLDEVGRMKPARTKWTEYRWPLIEARMSKRDCVRWLEEHGLEVPKKSSCVFCPFHSDSYWRNLKNEHPDLWEEAVEADRALRKLDRIDDECYIHPSGQPLEEVELDTQGELGGDFMAECTGHCGI